MKKISFQFLLLFFLTSLVSPLSASFYIQDIEVDSSGDDAVIQLKLKEEVQGKSLVSTLTTGPGWLRLDLEDTAFSLSLQQKEVFDGFVKIINMYKIGDDAQLEVALQDIFFTLPNDLDITNDSQSLRITINKKKQAASTDNTPIPQLTDSTNTEQQLDNSTDELLFSSSVLADIDASGDTSNFSTLSGGEEYDLSENIIQLFIFLLVLLAVMYLIMVLVNKYGFNKYSIKNQKYQINVISTKMLTPRQKILILEINGKKFACGVSKDQISYLTLIPDSLMPEIDELSNSPSITVAALRTNFLEKRKEYEQEEMVKKQKKSESAKKQSKSDGFRDELMSKIKNLKKFD